MDNEPHDVLALFVRLWLRNQTAAERIFGQLDDGQDWSLMADDLRAEIAKLRDPKVIDDWDLVVGH